MRKTIILQIVGIALFLLSWIKINAVDSEEVIFQIPPPFNIFTGIAGLALFIEGYLLFRRKK